jgi:hypothetical protein
MTRTTSNRNGSSTQTYRWPCDTYQPTLGKKLRVSYLFHPDSSRLPPDKEVASADCLLSREASASSPPSSVDTRSSYCRIVVLPCETGKGDVMMLDWLTGVSVGVWCRMAYTWRGTRRCVDVCYEQYTLFRSHDLDLVDYSSSQIRAQSHTVIAGSSFHRQLSQSECH